MASASTAVKRLLSVEDAIQTRRLMRNPQAVQAGNPQGAVSVSPSGRHYVARLLRGDVKADGVWMDLITGSLASLDEALRYEHVARLFSTGLGDGPNNFGPAEDMDEYANPVRWLDEDHVAFMWSDADHVRQVVKVSLREKRFQYLTHHPTHVVAFDISPKGTVVYSAQARAQPCEHDDEQGMVIAGGVDAFGVFQGDLCHGTLMDRASNTQWFVQSPDDRAPRQLQLDGRAVERDNRHRIDLSPDGKHALINLTAGKVPSSWSAYTERNVKRWIAEARVNPNNVMARNIHRLFILDVQAGTARPLWEAVSLIDTAQAAWSPDGHFVALAPTYLPPDEPEASTGRAGAVVDVATGRYVTLPDTFPTFGVVGLQWIGDARLVVRTRGEHGIEKHEFARQADGSWRAVAAATAAQHESVRIEVREGLNTPPRFIAVDARSGVTREILTLNPDLERYELGRRERLHGVLPTGETWAAILFYPVHYVEGQRYPLVIQSVYGRGQLSDEFTLYGYQDGAGLGPTKIAPYPGQLLANRGIAVLHLNVSVGHTRHNTSQEAAGHMRGFEALARQLAEAGLVDPARVGLLGFSRNGYYVTYTLTHSSFPFAAAISADNWDPSYVAETLNGYGPAGEAVNGAAAFGEGLQQWLVNTPGFNADQVHTPLRMIEQSLGRYGVLTRWELFSRLRYLNKPVEIYLPPDADHGTHVTQNPRQIAALQQGSIEWFDFWLNGREDPNPEKAAQYERWRKLRQQHEAHLEELRGTRRGLHATRPHLSNRSPQH